MRRRWFASWSLALMLALSLSGVSASAGAVEEPLDRMGFGLEAHAGHEFHVEISLLGTHASDVKAEHGLHRRQR